MAIKTGSWIEGPNGQIKLAQQVLESQVLTSFCCCKFSPSASGVVWLT